MGIQYFYWRMCKRPGSCKYLAASLVVGLFSHLGQRDRGQDVRRHSSRDRLGLSAPRPRSDGICGFKCIASQLDCWGPLHWRCNIKRVNKEYLLVVVLVVVVLVVLVGADVEDIPCACGSC